MMYLFQLPAACCKSNGRRAFGGAKSKAYEAQERTHRSISATIILVLPHLKYI